LRPSALQRRARPTKLLVEGAESVTDTSAVWGRTGRPANVVLPETLDADGFFDLLGAALARLP